MDTVWTLVLALLGVVIGWRGYGAVTTGEMKGKAGMTYRGNVAKGLGIVFLALGALLVFVGLGGLVA